MRIVTFGALLSVALLAAPAASHAEGLSVGDTATFKMTGSDGKTYSSEQFKDKQMVVIAWFPKAFTGGCTKECISLRESGKALRKYDVAYFTASVDPVKKNTAFAESLKLDYPILSDPDKSVAKAFGCLNDRGFSNRWTYYIGEDGKVLHIEKGVKAASHADQIVAKLEELGVEKKE